MNIILKVINCFYRIYCRMLRNCRVHDFAKCGNGLRFHPETSEFIYSHISIGNDVYIGPRACFMASIAHIYIGNKVVFGPNVTIRGGIIFLIFLVNIFWISLMKTKDHKMIKMLL